MGWNFEKDGLTITEYFNQLWPHILRLIKLERGVKDIGHAFVNIFVEACRLSPYHAGHLAAVLYLLTIITIIGAFLAL